MNTSEVKPLPPKSFGEPKSLPNWKPKPTPNVMSLRKARLAQEAEERKHATKVPTQMIDEDPI